MRGLLFSQMAPPAELVEEFHEWYDAEHVPNRLALRGFASATRSEAVGDETRYLVTYELSDMAVLDTPEYEEIKRNPGQRTERMLGAVHDFTRYTAETVWSSDTSTRVPVALVVHAVGAPDLNAEGLQKLVDAIGAVPGRPRDARTHIHQTIGASVGPLRTHIVVHEFDAASILEDARTWLETVASEIGKVTGTACEWLHYRPFRHTRSDWT